jgi:hypothetical protein
MRQVTRGESGSLEATYGEKSAGLRRAIARYMLAAPVVLATPSALVPSDPEQRIPETGYHSDGEWFWSGSGARLFEQGQIDLQPEFVTHAIRQRTPPTELSEEQLQSVMQFLVERGG